MAQNFASNVDYEVSMTDMVDLSTLMQRLFSLHCHFNVLHHTYALSCPLFLATFYSLLLLPFFLLFIRIDFKSSLPSPSRGLQKRKTPTEDIINEPHSFLANIRTARPRQRAWPRITQSIQRRYLSSFLRRTLAPYPTRTRVGSAPG